MPYVLLQSRHPVNDAPCMIEEENINEEIRTKSEISFSKKYNYVCLESPAEVIKKLQNLGYYDHGPTGGDITRAWILTKGDDIVIKKNKKEIDEDGSEEDDDDEEDVQNSSIDDLENVDDSEFDESDEELESSQADEEHNNDSAELEGSDERDGLDESQSEGDSQSEEEDKDNAELESSDEEDIDLSESRIPLHGLSSDEEDIDLSESRIPLHGLSSDEDIYELESSDEENGLDESKVEEEDVEPESSDEENELDESKFEEDSDDVEPESSDEQNELDESKIEEDHQSQSEDEDIYELESSDEEVHLNESEEEDHQSEEEAIQTKLLEEDVHHVEMVEEDVHQTVKEDDSLQTKVVQEDAGQRLVWEEYATEDGDTSTTGLESSLEHDATFEDDAIDGRVRYRKEKKISLIDYVRKSPCPSSENVSVQAEVITNENLMVAKEEFQSPEVKEPEEFQSPEVTVCESLSLRSTNVSIQNEVILYANNENLVVVKEELQEVVEQNESQSPEKKEPEKIPQEFQSLEVKTPERSQVNEQEELQSPEIIKISLINYVRKSSSSRRETVSIQNEGITNENLVVREEPQLLEELHNVAEQEPEESPEVKEAEESPEVKEPEESDESPKVKESEEKELEESPEVKAPEESKLLEVKEELQPQLQEEQEEPEDSMEEEMGFTRKDLELIFDMEDNDDEHDMDYEANTSPIQESTIVTRRRSSRLGPIPTKPPSSSNSHAKPRTKKNSADHANNRITRVVIGESATVQVSGNTRGRSQSHQPGLVGVGEFLAEKAPINQQPTSTSRTVSPGTTSEDSDLPPKEVKKSRKRKSESKQSSQRLLFGPQRSRAQGGERMTKRSAIDQQQTSSSTNTSAGPSTTSESSDIPPRVVEKSKQSKKRKTSLSPQPDLFDPVELSELLDNCPYIHSSSTNTCVVPSTTSENSAIPPKDGTRQSTKRKTSQQSQLYDWDRGLQSLQEKIFKSKKI